MMDTMVSQLCKKKPDMLNALEYTQLMKEFAANDGNEVQNGIVTEPNGIDTDWFDELFNTAPITEHNVTATLGSKFQLIT